SRRTDHVAGLGPPSGGVARRDRPRPRRSGRRTPHPAQPTYGADGGGAPPDADRRGLRPVRFGCRCVRPGARTPESAGRALSRNNWRWRWIGGRLGRRAGGVRARRFAWARPVSHTNQEFGGGEVPSPFTIVYTLQLMVANPIALSWKSTDEMEPVFG